jgi:Bacterial Ig domain
MFFFPRLLRFRLCSLIFLALGQLCLGAPPVAVDESFSVTEDTVLMINAADGLLINDSDAAGRVLEALVVSPPAVGQLTVGLDGALMFTPPADFSGSVTFTYQVRTQVPPVAFTIDPSRSRLQMTADLTGNSSGLVFGASDVESSRVDGTLWAVLPPAPGALSTAQVSGAAMRLIDPMELNFNIGCFPGFGCLATIVVKTRVAEPDYMRLSLITSGPGGAVSPAGLFDQLGNFFSMNGLADVTATGAAATAVPNGPSPMETTGLVEIQGASITSAGGVLTLKVPVVYSGRFVLDPAAPTANFVDVGAKSAFPGSTGYIIGTAPVSALQAEVSAPVTVTFNVLPVDDAPVAHADTYTGLQGVPLVVPAVSGVLANDTDIDSPSSAFSLKLIEPVDSDFGSLTLQPNGAFSFIPARGFSGTADFVYEVQSSPSSVPTRTPVLNTGDIWKYRADGVDLGTQWFSVGYDDSAWASGPSELGYGDAAEGRPEATNVRPDIATPIYPTYYFRTTFRVTQPVALIDQLRIDLLRDDAAAIYINGIEVFHDDHLSATATGADYTIGHQGTPSETAYLGLGILPAGLGLHEGMNTIAVEVHQASSTSSDLSFDLRLSTLARSGARVSLAIASDDADGDGISDIFERQEGLDSANPADAAEDADGDGMTNRFEFLAGLPPRMAGPALAVREFTTTGPTPALILQGLTPTRTYQVETSTDCRHWAPLGSRFTPTSDTASRPLPPLVVGPAETHFYRLAVLWQFP